MICASARADVSLRRLFPTERILGATDILAKACTHDARQVRAGDVYVAVLGAEADGHDRATEAVQRGAAAIVCERLLPVACPQLVVEDSRVALGRICQALAGSPQRSLQTVGVTGTHGKTSVGLLLGHVWEAAGWLAGANTSLACVDGRASSETATSPEDVALWLARSAANGCGHVILESNARQLAEQRWSGIELDLAVVTNLSRSHDAWFRRPRDQQAAQLRILQQLKPGGCAIINADDARLADDMAAWSGPVLRFGMNMAADVRAEVLERCASEQTFLLAAGSQVAPVRARVIGDQHVRHCLAAASVALLYELPLRTIVAGLEAADVLPGRLQRVECGQPSSVFVDSAQTPERLAYALHALRQVTQGRLICVFGGRDDRPGTAARLGRVVEKWADRGVITSLARQGSATLEEMHCLLDGYDRPAEAHVMPNRRRAVAYAVSQAREGDTVLIAGCQPAPPSAAGVIPDLPEIEWTREALNGGAIWRDDPAPEIYPIWNYRP